MDVASGFPFLRIATCCFDVLQSKHHDSMKHLVWICRTVSICWNSLYHLSEVTVQNHSEYCSCPNSTYSSYIQFEYSTCFTFCSWEHQTYKYYSVLTYHARYCSHVPLFLSTEEDAVLFPDRLFRNFVDTRNGRRLLRGRAMLCSMIFHEFTAG